MGIIDHSCLCQFLFPRTYNATAETFNSSWNSHSCTSEIEREKDGGEREKCQYGPYCTTVAFGEVYHPGEVKLQQPVVPSKRLKEEFACCLCEKKNEEEKEENVLQPLFLCVCHIFCRPQGLLAEPHHTHSHREYSNEVTTYSSSRKEVIYSNRATQRLTLLIRKKKKNRDISFSLFVVPTFPKETHPPSRIPITPMRSPHSFPHPPFSIDLFLYMAFDP